MSIIVRGFGPRGSGDEARVVTAEIEVEVSETVDVEIAVAEYDISVEVCDE